MLNIKAG
jgi:protein phosphatase